LGRRDVGLDPPLVPLDINYAANIHAAGAGQVQIKTGGGDYASRTLK